MTEKELALENQNTTKKYNKAVRDLRLASRNMKQALNAVSDHAMHVEQETGLSADGVLENVNDAKETMDEISKINFI